MAHHFGFGLYYEPAANRFSLLENPNYNYED